jgi:hypothetical protein
MRKVSQPMGEISQDRLEERYRSRPFAKPMDEFCRRWLEANCDSDDLSLMKAVRADLWGPGAVISETDYHAINLGRMPSRNEVEALIGRVFRVLEPCHEAWCESADYRVRGTNARTFPALPGRGMASRIDT